jgi:hypothetical protein
MIVANRSAWKSATPKEPSRRVRYDSRRPAHRLERRNFGYAAHIFDEKYLPGLAAADHTVPYGTVRSVDDFPGTSCQATIMLSLWD